MAYSKAKVKSNGEKASLYFQPILMGNKSDKYINKIQQDATDAGIYYCKLILHVSGVCRPHHQEYIKL